MESSFFNRTVEETLSALGGTKAGLTSKEAAERLQKHGKNALAEWKKKSGLQVFLDQFKDLLVVILIIAALISMVSDNVESTVVIFAVLILNAVLGTVQHFKAEKSLESLKAMSSPSAKVLRDGVRSVVPSAQVVPGDIVELEAFQSVLFRQQHGAMFPVIDDIHFCCDWLLCLRNVRHLKLRLFRSMMHDLQTILLTKPKHLQVVFWFWHLIDSLPHHHLQCNRYLCIHASCQVSAF